MAQTPMTQPCGRSTLLRRLTEHVRERPDKPFLVLYQGEQFRVVSFAALQRSAERWAQRFGALGAAPGASAFLVLRHGEAAYAAFLGAMMAGLVPSFLPPPSPKQDPEAFWAAQRAVFARAKLAVAVVGRLDAEALSQAAAVDCPLLVAEDEPALDDVVALVDPEAATPALIQFSSGTTGLKKAVRLSFEQIDRHVGMLAAALDMGPADIVASWLPLYHDMGLFAAFLAPLTLGASVVAIDPFAWVAEPASILRAVERHRATLSWAPNFAFAHLTRTHDPEAAYDLSTLRALIDCSEPCRPETIEAFCETFHPHGLGAERIACSYGMAEAVFAVTQTTPGEPPRVLEVDAEALEQRGEITRADGRRAHQFMSCGAPLPGVDLRIAPPGTAASAGVTAVGEIEVASAVLFDGYHHGEAEPVDPPVDGWRRTGDIGFIHEGELFVCGRTMERLIVHGRTFYAGDIEAIASAVEGVKAGRAVALGVLEESTGAEEAWVMLEAQAPVVDTAHRETLVKAVRRAVQDALDVTLRGVEIGPPGWLAKSTSGKMSRSANLEKLTRLIAQQPKPQEPAAPTQAPPVEAPLYGPTLPATPTPPMREPAALDFIAPPGPVEAAVRQALAECFGRAGAKLIDTDGMGDAPGWDSLGHTLLILRIEALTGLKASETAVAGARTVGALIRAFDALAPAAIDRCAA